MCSSHQHQLSVVSRFRCTQKMANTFRMIDDTKGGASKIDMDHSQNIQSCTCTPKTVEYLRSLVFTPIHMSDISNLGFFKILHGVPKNLDPCLMAIKGPEVA